MSRTFDELMESIGRDGLRLNQNFPEWRAFLEYAAGYFHVRGIVRPIVVEIGILDGAQRRFYEELLGADYISIDNGATRGAKGMPTIRADSRDKQTLETLDDFLTGRPIDLLFIDGLHTYEGVKSDYQMYGPLTRHIIAIHDIHTPKLGPMDQVEVYRLWAEILANNERDTIITFQHHNRIRPEDFNGRSLGIGVVVKGEQA
jgi:hypothetical protein